MRLCVATVITTQPTNFRRSKSEPVDAVLCLQARKGCQGSLREYCHFVPFVPFRSCCVAVVVAVVVVAVVVLLLLLLLLLLCCCCCCCCCNVMLLLLLLLFHCCGVGGLKNIVIDSS